MPSHPQPIAPYLTMHIGGTVADIIKLTTLTDVERLHRQSISEHIPWFILGSGSNTIFSETYHHLIVGKVEIDGITRIHENADSVTLTVGAGVLWDTLVAYAVLHNLQGIEALSAIPGTVGATPVQNVGAYGTDIAQTLVSISAYDTQTRTYTDIKKSDCSFGYRDSLFKHEKRFIIISVTFTLTKQSPDKSVPIPAYSGVKEHLERISETHPTLSDIRKTIIAIRKEKLPDPTVIHNSGSFFKNPRLSEKAGKAFIEKFPEAPYFIEAGGLYKIPAGWLLEHAGFKGFPGPVGTYEQNALVVVNRGGYFSDLTTLIDTITTTIRKTCNINLEIEPNIIY